MKQLRLIQEQLATKNFNRAIDAFRSYAAEKNVLPKREFLELFELFKHQNNSISAYSMMQLMPYVAKSQFVLISNRFLCQLIDQNQLEDSLTFLRTIQIANTGQMDIEYGTLEKLMLSAKYHNDVEFAWQSVMTMRSLYTNLYSRTWGLFLSLVLENNHYEALEWIWKEAAIPGYIVLDDHSYTMMARIASQHGNMEMCNWAVIGLRGRHEFLGIETLNSLQLSIYLIEAAATNGLSKRKLEGSIRAACRLIVRLEDEAGNVPVHSLKQFLRSLDDPKVLEYVEAMYQELLKDPRAHENVKALFFNVLLKHSIERDDQSLSLYHEACQAQVEFNEDSLLLLLGLGRRMWDLGFCRQIMQLDSYATRTAKVRKVYEAAHKALA